MTSDSELKALGERLGAVLVARGASLATAESCTGGWIAKVITDIPGSSAWFDCGLVTYSNAAKQRLLRVPEDTIAEHGAVSAATVEAMVTGALTGSEAGIAVATSGVAGPGGGTADKPVGLVWFGWARRGHVPVARCSQFRGDRESIRRESVRVALEGLVEEADRPEMA